MRHLRSFKLFEAKMPSDRFEPTIIKMKDGDEGW